MSGAGDRAEQRAALTRAIGFRAGALLVGCLVALLLAEGLLRLLDIRPPQVRTKQQLEHGNLSYLCYTSNPHGEFAPAPVPESGDWRLYDFTLESRERPLEELKSTPWCVARRRNSLGLREDREFPPRAPPGVVRVLGIGDSFAEGEGVPLERSLFKQIEQLLGPGFEVINAGRSGNDLAQNAARAEWLAGLLSADRVLVVFIPNDIELTPELDRRQSFINDLINVRDQYLEAHEARAWYSGSLRLLELLGSFFERRGIAAETIQWYLDSYDPRQNPQGLAALDRDFGRLARLPGVRVALVLFPLMVGLEGGYPLAPVHATVAEHARRAGLPVLDLAPIFAGRETAALRVHDADHHPNGTAHGLAAQAIVDWLRRDLPAFVAPAAGVTGPGRPAGGPGAGTR